MVRRPPCSRRASACVVAAVVAAYLCLQLLLSTSYDARSAGAAVPLPLLLKLHKTGGTSLASALARAVLCDDAAYGAWRARLDGRAAPAGDAVARGAFGGGAVEALRGARGGGRARTAAGDAVAGALPDGAFRSLSQFCGNYDGHWATKAYRYLGPSGMRLCGGLAPARPRAKLVTLLRDPAPRFVSRLYYELGGSTSLLLAPPFSGNASAWSPGDVRTMEKIVCDACAKINGGHCAWRGGICDTPQEYLVVLSRLGPLGGRGRLQRSGGKREAAYASIAAPNRNRARLADARKRAEHALLHDFAVVGVLEDLHTFFVLLAAELDWPLERLLYATRKSHVAPSTSGGRETPCGRGDDAPADLIQGRLTKRRDERLKKRADALAMRTDAKVEWSGVWPLLGWNDPKKGPLRPETKAYVDKRNADDRALWRVAGETATRRLAAKPGGDADKRRFDALQKAYVAGVVKDGQGFYSFCDWRVKDYERAANRAGPGAAFHSDETDPNAACLRCAAALDDAPCAVAAAPGLPAAATRCRAGVDPGAVDFDLRYE